MVYQNQGVQNMGTGFDHIPRSPKKNKQKLTKTQSKRSTSHLEDSDDDLDVIGADDSATQIRVPKKTQLVWGKQVDEHPEYKKKDYKNFKIPKINPGGQYSKESSVASDSVESSAKSQSPETLLEPKSSTSSFSAHPTFIPIPGEAPRPKPRQIKKAAAFRKDSPIDLTDEKGPTSSRASSSKGTDSVASSSHRSPKRRRKKELELAPFPLELEPLGKRDKTTRASSRKQVLSSDEGDGQQVEAKETKLAEFPMTDSELRTIGSSPVGSPVGAQPNKKRKHNLEDVIEISFISQTPQAMKVDPSRLCPYCDAILPSNPSLQLLNLITQTASKSYPHPRPNNPKGLKAPVTTYIAVCQRHDFENDVLPKAAANGWPREIDWASLRDRIQELKPYIEELIKNPDGKARRRCIFWREILEDIKAKGTRTVKGVKGQFESFEKIQPGYYGEMGSTIIHQTLFNMFPLSSFDRSWITPLTAEEFIRTVLVPEVATQLIRQDQSLKQDTTGTVQAVRILRESSGYGVAMFPDDSGIRPPKNHKKKKPHDAFVEDEDEEMGVGDQILMERARQRRKEIAQEVEMFSEKEQRPRPRPRQKIKSSGSVVSLTDSHSNASSSDSDDCISDVSTSNRKRKPTIHSTSHYPRAKMKRSASGKSLGEVELTSDEEVTTSNEDGPLFSSSVTHGSSPISVAEKEDSDMWLPDADKTVQGSGMETTPMKPTARRVPMKTSRKARAKWSTSLAKSRASSSGTSSPPPAKVDKSGSSWLLDDVR